ncbi:MAG: HutD family protein [Holophaga sp.]
MHAHLFKSSDYHAMPWRNGGGLTTQLAIEPENATLESGFHWRLSMADVRMDGPFSAFPDYERTILLLKGKGIDLDFNGHGRKRLATPLDPFHFPGEWHATGELLDGPCRDFNVITHKGFTQQVTVLRPEPRSVVPAAPTSLLFCVQGKACVTPAGKVLNQHDLLRLEGAGVLEVTAEAPDTVIIAIAIGPE